MKQYTAGVIGCGRMGGFIDNEWIGGPLEFKLPHAHAAVYEAVERVELVACCDPRQDILALFGERYGIPVEKRYIDYREMLRKEQLDIVSITTQPEQRAEIALFACEHGARALYCEKALCASLEEADAIVEAVSRRNIAFNMGTGRRWDTGNDETKRLVQSGDLGALKSIVIYGSGALFNSGSHWFDLALWLNDDTPVEWVQGYLPNGDAALDGNVLRKDPVGEGIIHFANGVNAYALHTPRGPEIEAICERGVVSSLNNGLDRAVRRAPKDSHARWQLRSEAHPEYVKQSTNKRLVEDLVHALDTGERTRGGVEVARANLEIIAALVESHRRGGARVVLPLADRSLRLESGAVGRQPKVSSALGADANQAQ